MGILKDKRALILGVASNRSIAWGVASAMRAQGAELAFTYQNERLGGRVQKLAAEVDSSICIECDVAEPGATEKLRDDLAAHWDSFDICVHAIAFAPREALQGDYLDAVNQEAFAIAHDVSAYSFAALGKAFRPMLKARAGSMLTLTYLGAERVVANYNVMGLAKASLEANVRYMAAAMGNDGIRVNGISAGPIKTLAAAGISDFRRFLEVAERTAPLKRNVTINEVGNAAAFLCSDLASGITGEITYVDAGFNIMAIGDLSNPDS